MKFKGYVFLAILVVASTLAWATSQDIWSLKGKFSQAVRMVDVIRLTNTASPDLLLYNGDFVAYNSGVVPTTSDGGHGGFIVYLKNVSGGSVSQGDVVISSVGVNGGFALPNSAGDSKVIGVADETIANNSVGRVAVGGLSVVKTTHTVAVGDILISTAAPAGRASSKTSPTAGTVLGKAITSGAAAGDTVVVLLHAD